MNFSGLVDKIVAALLTLAYAQGKSALSQEDIEKTYKRFKDNNGDQCGPEGFLKWNAESRYDGDFPGIMSRVVKLKNIYRVSKWKKHLEIF